MLKALGARRRVLLAIPLLGIVCLILFPGCGRTPPPDLWSWSAQDSTKIVAQVVNWKQALRTVLAESLALTKRCSLIPDTTGRALHKNMKENRFKPRFFPGVFSRTITEYTMVDSATPTRDTTVTVKLSETFSGAVTINTESTNLFLQESIIGGLHYRFYTDTFVARETTLVIPYVGSCDRYLCFEPNDKVTRDTWILKCISGAARIASPDDAGAPLIYGLWINTNSGRRDTFMMRPDSTHYGAQRLYRLDSLLTYTTADSINVRLPKAYWDAGYVDPKDVFAFIHLPLSDSHSYRRPLHPFPDDTTSFAFSSPGLKQVYFEVMPRAALTEITPSFTSRIWGIPLTIRNP